MKKKSRLPRKLKKQLKGLTLKYDVSHLPEGYTMDKIECLLRTTGMLYYSSDKYTGEGVEIDSKCKNKGIKFIDVLGNTH